MYFRADKKNSKNISIYDGISYDKEGNEVTILDVLKTEDPDFNEEIYKNDNIKYLYYSDNMDYIISNFKSKYLDSVIDKSSYITNICIKNVKINTANKYISEFRNKKK